MGYLDKHLNKKNSRTNASLNKSSEREFRILYKRGIHDYDSNDNPIMCLGCQRLITPYDNEANNQRPTNFWDNNQEDPWHYHPACYANIRIHGCWMCEQIITPYTKRITDPMGMSCGHQRWDYFNNLIQDSDK
jgi:hypothetical protein